MERRLTAHALIELERKVVSAAVLWVNDQGCSSALGCLEDTVAELLAARQAIRKCRLIYSDAGAYNTPQMGAKKS